MSKDDTRDEAEIEKQEQEFFVAWASVRQQGVASTFRLAHGQEMSATQFALLNLIERAQGREPCTISWLASQAGLDPATVVRSIDILERRGLVERRRSTQDRRQVFVTLTEQGTALQQDLHQKAMMRLSKNFRAMSAEGRQALLRGLREFLQIGRLADEPEQ